MGKGLSVQFQIYHEKVWDYLRNNFNCADSLDDFKQKIPSTHIWVYNESFGVICLGDGDVMKFRPNQCYEIKSNSNKNIELIIGFVTDPQIEYSSDYNLGIEVNYRLEFYKKPEVISYFPITHLNFIMSQSAKKSLLGAVSMPYEKYDEGYKEVEDYFASLGFKSTRNWTRDRDSWDPIWQFNGEYGQITIDYINDSPISNTFLSYLNWAKLPRF